METKTQLNQITLKGETLPGLVGGSFKNIMDWIKEHHPKASQAETLMIVRMTAKMLISYTDYVMKKEKIEIIGESLTRVKQEGK